jgi:hypothetical protein
MSFPAPNTAGNGIALVVGTPSSAVPQVSDSNGNTYSMLASVTNVNRSYLFFAKGVAGGANTVSVTWSNGAGGDAAALEYAGVVLDGGIALTDTGTGNAQPMTAGPVQLSPGAMLLFYCNNSLGSGMYDAGAGFQLRAANGYGAVEDRAIVAAGAYAGTLHFSSPAVNWQCVLAGVAPRCP